jgi:hypothetical protein
LQRKNNMIATKKQLMFIADLDRPDFVYDGGIFRVKISDADYFNETVEAIGEVVTSQTDSYSGFVNIETTISNSIYNDILDSANASKED